MKQPNEILKYQYHLGKPRFVGDYNKIMFNVGVDEVEFGGKMENLGV